MKNQVNVVTKKESHCGEMLSAIPTAFSSAQGGDPQVLRTAKSGMTTKDCFAYARNDGRKGFTLIELLVVVLIIGILAAVAVPKYQLVSAKARYAELMPIVQNLRVQQEIYYLENGSYATTCKQLNPDIPSGFTYDTDNNLVNTKKQIYINCLNHNNNKGYRVAGIIYGFYSNGNRQYHVSHEQFLKHTVDKDTNGPITYQMQCWNTTNASAPTYWKEVCKSFCSLHDTGAYHGNNSECQW